MRHNTLTTVRDLKPGDRFSKEDGDIIYTVLDKKCTIKGQRYVRKGDLKMTDIIDLKKTVIFLYHETIKKL